MNTLRTAGIIGAFLILISAIAMAVSLKRESIILLSEMPE